MEPQGLKNPLNAISPLINGIEIMIKLMINSDLSTSLDSQRNATPDCANTSPVLLPPNFWNMYIANSGLLFQRDIKNLRE